MHWKASHPCFPYNHCTAMRRVATHCITSIALPPRRCGSTVRAVRCLVAVASRCPAASRPAAGASSLVEELVESRGRVRWHKKHYQGMTSGPVDHCLRCGRRPVNVSSAVTRRRSPVGCHRCQPPVRLSSAAVTRRLSHIPTHRRFCQPPANRFRIRGEAGTGRQHDTHCTRDGHPTRPAARWPACCHGSREGRRG